MFNLREYRRNRAHLADLLLWAALPAPGVVLQKDGSLMTTLHFVGHDLNGKTPSEVFANSARLNNLLKRLEAGWAIHIEAVREPTSTYPDSTWPCPVSALIDSERRAVFESTPHFTTSQYLTLTWQPPSAAARGFSHLFWREALTPDLDSQLSYFNAQVTQFAKAFADLCNHVTVLDDAALLTYLHGAVSTDPHPVAVPDNPMYLDCLLADRPYLGGARPKLGRHPLRCLVVSGFPGETLPRMFRDLENLDFPYRLSLRYIALSRSQAQARIRDYQRKWSQRRKGVFSLVTEMVSKREGDVPPDPESLARTDDATAALADLQDGAVSYGYLTATVRILGETDEEAERQLGVASRLIVNRGFSTLAESINSTEAWLGSLPGNVYANVRRPILSSFNLAHLMPYASPYQGEAECDHLNGPPLLHVDTEGYTPFRLNLHVSDVGHTLVIGPTGSGKTTLLGLIAAQFLRYPQAQVYAFDRHFGLKVILQALGGQYHDLGAGELAFQPLRDIDHDSDRSASSEWLQLLLHQESISVKTSITTVIWEALSLLAKEPVQYRTLTNLQHMLGDPQLREALTPYTIQGQFGTLFDAKADSLSLGAIEGFELDEVSHQGRALGPLLTYLFRRIEKRLTGQPTLIIIDEAWAALDHERFSEKIGNWVRTLRKLNTSVIFATQNLGDLMDKRISSVIFESCPTQLLLPNPKALEAESARLYQAIGLNEVEMQALAVAEPKQAYFYRSPLGQRWFSLSLGDCSRVLCGSSKREDIQVADDIGGRGPAFAASFLAQNGVQWGAGLLTGEGESDGP